MPNIAQQDMSYQPATKGYSFSTNPAAATEPEGTPKKKINIFILLILELLGLVTVFVIFLFVLNYFQVISLSSFLPNQLGKLPQTAQSNDQAYDSKTGLWTANGTFYGYNQHVIEIKINSQITNFQWTDGNSAAALYGSEKDFGNQNYSPTIYTLFDLEQNQNLGKKVIVQYSINNGVNNIANLSLLKQ